MRMGGDRDIGAELWRGTGTNAARGAVAGLRRAVPRRRPRRRRRPGPDVRAARAARPGGQRRVRPRAVHGRRSGPLPVRRARRPRRRWRGDRHRRGERGRRARRRAPAHRRACSTTRRSSRRRSSTSSARRTPAHAGADDRAATGAARILGAHMYGVQHALGSDNTVTDGERTARARRRRTIRRTPRTCRPPRSPSSPTARSRAPGRRRCSTLRRSRRSSAWRRAPTPASPALRAGLSRYDQAIAAATAARLADGGIAPSRAPAHLAEVMTDAARLEGTVLAHVGEAAREGGRGSRRDPLVLDQGRRQGRRRRHLAAGSGHAPPCVGAGADAAEDALVEVLAGAEREAVVAHHARVGRRRRAPDVPVGARAARGRPGRRRRCHPGSWSTASSRPTRTSS